jgi:predicted SAM-dependent methyltransferase
VTSPRKVHLGPGSNVLPGWDNLDLVEGEGIITHDLRVGLPYPDGSVSHIFSEHVIEHFTKADGYRLLCECYRVLQPTGCIRVGWPDLTKLLSAYLLRSRRYKRFITPYLEGNLFDTWDELFSDCLFDWEHRYAYTRKHLAMLLARIGFIDIRTRRFMESACGIYNDVRNDPATTYLEATKPQG